jgi:hypothetical protein
MQGKSIGNAGGMADLPSIKKVVNYGLLGSCHASVGRLALKPPSPKFIILAQQ